MFLENKSLAVCTVTVAAAISQNYTSNRCQVLTELHDTSWADETQFWNGHVSLSNDFCSGNNSNNSNEQVEDSVLSGLFSLHQPHRLSHSLAIIEESRHLNMGIEVSDVWRTYGQPMCSDTNSMLTSMHTHAREHTHTRTHAHTGTHAHTYTLIKLSYAAALN